MQQKLENQLLKIEIFFILHIFRILFYIEKLNKNKVQIDSTAPVSFTISFKETAENRNGNYTIEGTATNGADYNSIADSVTILDGASSATIDIMPMMQAWDTRQNASLSVAIMV